MTANSKLRHKVTRTNFSTNCNAEQQKSFLKSQFSSSQYPIFNNKIWFTLISQVVSMAILLAALMKKLFIIIFDQLKIDGREDIEFPLRLLCESSTDQLIYR